MTDITDPTAGIGEAWDRRVADTIAEFLTTFARGVAARPDSYSDDLVNSASAVLATVDAPATTLAEDLRHIAEHWEEWATDTITSAIRAAADRAEQVEKERDEARAEVERLNRERDRLQAQVQGLTRRDGDRNSEVRMLTEERSEALIEVERLTEALEQLSERVTARLAMPPGDIPGTALPINISPIVPDPTTPRPADVPAGEAWLVEVDGKKRAAVKDRDDIQPWNTVNAGGWLLTEDDEDITLVARLVPEPRTVRYEPKEK